MTIDVAEREALREAVRDLLRSRCTEHDVRRVMAGDDGFDRALWRQLAEQGVTGIVIDAEYGGVGLGARELEAVRLSTYTFDGAPAQRLGAAGWDAVQHALDLAVIALAGEQSGGARRIFDITVDYLKTRIQFGRPIGSFQALKHMAADLLLTVESATSAAQNAAAQKAAQLAGDVETADGAIALAGFTCAEAYRDTAAQAIQMHGGIGFTWEHPAHLYLRRARTGLQLFGGPRLHRERYLQSKGA